MKSDKNGNIKQKNKNNILNKIRNNYILKKIYLHLHEKRALEFLKYNKKLNQRLNIELNDYKKYFETYTTIEIEIIPALNQYGKFININKETEDSYTHIYFNDDKKEKKRNKLKRNYIYKRDKISKIKIVIDYQKESFHELFKGCECIESIHFIKFYRNNITDMSYMFCECILLQKIDLSNFNTNNVNNMSYMFCNCPSLTKLDLSNFNTSNATNMSFMFGGCYNLRELNVSNFNTSKVTDMCFMFYKCSALKEINLSNFNTSNVINFSHMFHGCTSLISLNLYNFRANNATKMRFMFAGCLDLLTLDVRNFHLKVDERVDTENMFYDLPSKFYRSLSPQLEKVYHNGRNNFLCNIF